MTWTADFAKNLERAKKRVPALESGTVIYAGEMEITTSAGTRFVNFARTGTLFDGETTSSDAVT